MEKEHNLRFEFVGMLFALAIGQVAIECGDIVLKHIEVWQAPHIFAHLFLATIIIATSWVGWQTSHSFGNTRLIRSNFSQQFLILLIDIFLVICYFIIVRGAEEYYKNIKGTGPNPDGQNQATWSSVIFFVFLIWDIGTKLIIPDYPNEPENQDLYIRRFHLDWRTFWNRGWQTILCFGLTLIGSWKMSGEATPWKIVWLDLYLVGNFFLFRGLKEVGTRKKYLERKDKISSGNLSPATLKKMGATEEVRDFNLKNTSKGYKWRVFFMVILPGLTVVLSAILYWK